MTDNDWIDMAAGELDMDGSKESAMIFAILAVAHELRLLRKGLENGFRVSQREGGYFVTKERLD